VNEVDRAVHELERLSELLACPFYGAVGKLVQAAWREELEFTTEARSQAGVVQEALSRIETACWEARKAAGVPQKTLEQLVAEARAWRGR
jgi:hypothetical protein